MSVTDILCFKPHFLKWLGSNSLCHTFSSDQIFILYTILFQVTGILYFTSHVSRWPRSYILRHAFFQVPKILYNKSNFKQQHFGHDAINKLFSVACLTGRRNKYFFKKRHFDHTINTPFSVGYWTTQRKYISLMIIWHPLLALALRLHNANIQL